MVSNFSKVFCYSLFFSQTWIDCMSITFLFLSKTSLKFSLKANSVQNITFFNTSSCFEKKKKLQVLWYYYFHILKQITSLLYGLCFQRRMKSTIRHTDPYAPSVRPLQETSEKFGPSPMCVWSDKQPRQGTYQILWNVQLLTRSWYDSEIWPTRRTVISY